MPLLKINTNRKLDDTRANHLLAEASRSVAEILGKPEDYVMVDLSDGRRMSFAGETAPLASLELKSLGLPEERTPALSAALCRLISDALGIPQERIYIEFSSPPRRMWGWDGRTF